MKHIGKILLVGAVLSALWYAFLYVPNADNKPVTPARDTTAVDSTKATVIADTNKVAVKDTTKK